MASAEPRVLHVLPHPGGGGETYVEALARMEGYRFERAYLALGADSRRSRSAVLANAVHLQRAAHSVDLVHVVGEVASTLCLPALALRASVMSPQGLHLLRRLDGALRFAAQANLRLIVRAATRTICSSNSEHSDVAAAVGARLAARAVVVSNGVHLPELASSERRAAVRAELGLPDSAVVGAWIAALDEHKDPISVVEAAVAARRKGLPVVLLIAGEGPLRTEVERLAHDADVVRVLGHRGDVDRILAASDFFVLASRREGLSFALLEAMAAGLVPVVSDAPGNLDAVGDTGFVVPFGDSGAFAEAFERVASDEQRRRVLGESARERVRNHFRADEMIRRTREIYGEVLASRRRRRAAA